MITQPASSRQFVLAPITVTYPPGYNPTGDAVQMAFVPEFVDPQSTDWHDAAWQSTSAPYVVQCLVGPGAVALSPGFYNIFVKITDSPEIPVLPAGQLKLT